MKTLETPKNINAKGSSSDYNVPTGEISAVETNLSFFFFFNINNSQSVYNKYLPFLQNILNELTCRAAMFCPAGKELWGSWFSVLLDILCLSSIRCACPQCDVVVLDTPYLSSIRCACPRYSVPVLSTLSCPFAVPVLCCAYSKFVELAFRCTCPF